MGRFKFLKTAALFLATAVFFGAAAPGGQVRAAGEEIELVYMNNKDGGNYVARVLRGDAITVKMNLGDFDLPSDAGSDQALLLTRLDGSVVDSGFSITGTNLTSTYQVMVNQIRAQSETYTLSGNINSITPPKTGYTGTVSAGGQSGDATLVTSQSISQLSTLAIECVTGESPTSPQPSFRFISGAGYFEDYQDASVSVRSAQSDVGSGKPFIKNKKITVELTKPGKTTLTISFFQTPVYSNIVDANDTGKYLEADGRPCADQANPTLIQNNFVRKGTKYQMAFYPPRSTLLSLEVAEPQFVAESIARNAQSNQENQYVQLSGDDTFNLIAENSFKLTTKDSRYNATFDLDWKWTPDADQIYGADPVIAEQAVVIPGTINTSSVTAKVNRQENDVTGKLTVGILLNGKAFPTAKATFNLRIRGDGVSASVVPESQKVGTPTGIESPAVPDKLPVQITMDAFQGGIPEYLKKPVGPFEYTLKLNMGLKNARSLYAVASLKTTEGKAPIELRTRVGGIDTPYVSGAQIANPHAGGDFTEQGAVLLVLNAKEAGKATLTIDFYIQVNGKFKIDSSYSTNLVVQNTAPSRDSTLKTMIIRDEGNHKTFDFGFKPDVTVYNDVLSLPYSYQRYGITPNVNDLTAAENDIKISAVDLSGAPAQIFNGLSSTTVKNGQPALFDMTTTNKVYELTVTVQAQDPRISTSYRMRVMRAAPSLDDTLSSLGLYLQNDEAMKSNLVTGFSNNNRGPYIVTVPYSEENLRVQAVQNFPGAKVLYDPPLKKMSNFGPEIFLDLSKCMEYEVPNAGGLKLPRLQIKVIPESNVSVDGSGADGIATGIYNVFIQREEPSKESRLGALTIADAADQTANPKSIAYTPSFGTDNPGPYRVQIPYSIKELRFKVTPKNEKVSSITILDGQNVVATIDNPKVYSTPVAIKAMDLKNNFPYHDLTIRVVAESGKGLQAPPDVTTYTVRVERAEPSGDSALTNVVIKDQDNTQIKTFSFHRDEHAYSITVPYETRQVNFTPTVSQAGAKIQMKDHGNPIHSANLFLDDLTPGVASKFYDLGEHSTPRAFELIVTAEDGKTKQSYTFTITREAPSTDALLKALSVTGITTDGLSPIFKPNTLKYEATVETGAKGVTITPTASSKFATITVDKIVVESGAASDLIELLEEKVKVLIVVTAQDGKTQKTYVIEFYNKNLVDLNDNADLRSLYVDYGLMTPSFKPSITEYEVAVKEDTYSVDILPRTDDKLATYQVFAGTKEIGDYDDNFSQAIAEGETDITIRVTSSDKTKTKDYEILVYRNEEDMLKTLTPMTADDIDFAYYGDEIIISLSEYPRVSADVFEELKNFPEKTIIFQGNDYSLRFKASELDTVIPIREIYDFRMLLESPDEEEINDLIDDKSSNDDIDDSVVMLYFDYHGDLPGPATLNISLGDKYGSRPLYWHYYNKERERIDYYGQVRSNTQGTFAVTIDHFSTYLVSRKHRIFGSEDYSNEYTDEIEVVYLNAETGGDKHNPNTGSKGEKR